MPSRRSALHNFTAQTPLHGLAWAVDAKQVAYRVFWVMMLAGALVGFGYQTSRSIKLFNAKYPATTYTVTDEDSLVVPKIDIALPARFDKYKVKRYGVSEDVVQMLHLCFAVGYMQSFAGYHVDDVFGSKLQSFMQNMIANGKPQLDEVLTRLKMSDVGYLIDKLSFDCEDFVETCVIYERRYIPRDCCKDYTTSLYGFMGKSIRFEAINQLIDGQGQGRFLRLTVPSKRYVPGPMTAPFDGVMMVLVPEYPESTILYVPRKTRTQIVLSKTTGTYLNTKANPCEDRGAEQPSVAHCLTTCIFNQLFGICSCRPYDLGRVDDKPVCTPTTLAFCLLAGVRTAESVHNTTRVCRGQCKRPCRIEQYTAVVNSIPLSTNQVFDLWNTSVMQDDDIILDVHYKTLQVVVIYQYQSLTVEGLFGNIGGLLGLWLGGSILAVVHLVFYWIEDASAQRCGGQTETVTFIR